MKPVAAATHPKFSQWLVQLPVLKVAVSSVPVEILIGFSDILGSGHGPRKSIHNSQDANDLL